MSYIIGKYDCPTPRISSKCTYIGKRPTPGDIFNTPSSKNIKPLPENKPVMLVDMSFDAATDEGIEPGVTQKGIGLWGQDRYRSNPLVNDKIIIPKKYLNRLLQKVQK